MLRPALTCPALLLTSALLCGAVSPAALHAAPSVRLAQAEPGAEAPLKWRPATEAEKKAGSTVIEAQLKAFKADDYATADKHQHSGLRQGLPPGPEGIAAFRALMRKGYPQVTNYKSVTFGAARATKDPQKGERLEIPATVLGEDGITVRMIYTLLKEAGAFRIASVSGGQPSIAPPRDIA